MVKIIDIDEILLIRVTFIFTAGYLLYEGFQNWLRGRIYTHPQIIYLLLITYALAFLMIILGLSTDLIVRRVRHIPLPALLFIVIFSSYVISMIVYNGVYRTDAIAFTHYSAIIFLEKILMNAQNMNPYTMDLQAALIEFPVDVDYITFTENGDIITRLNYPALHFLIFIPFIYKGINDMRWVIYLFSIASIITIYGKSPSRLRPFILIPLFAGSDLLINFTAGSVTDFLWILPLLWAVLHLHNPYLSGTFFGLSAAIKQEPWILAPFLIIWVWKGDSPNYMTKAKVTLTFIITAFTAFLIPNLYFIIDNFSEWWNSIFEPMLGNLIVLSQGFSMLTQMAILPIGKPFYLVCMITIYILLTINYFVYYDKLKYTAFIYPAIILWFSYRGLQNYFISLIPLITASLVLWYKEKTCRGGMNG